MYGTWKKSEIVWSGCRYKPQTPQRVFGATSLPHLPEYTLITPKERNSEFSALDNFIGYIFTYQIVSNTASSRTLCQQTLTQCGIYY